MKHLVFPTKADADAFIADLQAQNVVQSVTADTTFRRTTDVVAPAVTDTTVATEKTVTTEVVEGGGDAGDMASGAVKGGALGTAAGLAAGALVAATGGVLAVPVVLGLAAGATAGMVRGALGGHGRDDEAGVHQYVEGTNSYTLADDHYDRLNTAVGTDGRAVAVDDNIPANIVEAAAARHKGRFV